MSGLNTAPAEARLVGQFAPAATVDRLRTPSAPLCCQPNLRKA